MQRFATLADIDASNPTVEEREEYEAPVGSGWSCTPASTTAAILAPGRGRGGRDRLGRRQQRLPVLRARPADRRRRPAAAGPRARYHPGEANLRMADVVVVNKVDSAAAEDVERVLANVAAVNPAAVVLAAESPVTLDAGPVARGRRCSWSRTGRRSPTAGCRSAPARSRRARPARPSSSTRGRTRSARSRRRFERFPHIGAVLPAMGYAARSSRDLERDDRRGRATSWSPARRSTSGG